MQQHAVACRPRPLLRSLALFSGGYQADGTAAPTSHAASLSCMFESISGGEVCKRTLKRNTANSYVYVFADVWTQNKKVLAALAATPDPTTDCPDALGPCPTAVATPFPALFTYTLRISGAAQRRLAGAGAGRDCMCQPSTAPPVAPRSSVHTTEKPCRRGQAPISASLSNDELTYFKPGTQLGPDGGLNFPFR